MNQMNHLESKIIDLIETNYGLKRTEIVFRIMGLNLEVTQGEVMDQIFDMVKSGQLIELEMVFPNHVSKSFLVPKGTTINVIRKK